MKSFILISVYLLRIEDQSGDLLPLDRPEEAGCVAGMTRCASLFHLIEEGVRITVDEYPADQLYVAAFLPFFPDLLPASAVVVRVSGCSGKFQRLSVCVGEHQNITCPPILCYDRDQTVFEIYIHTYHIPAIAFMITKKMSPTNNAVRNPAVIGMMNGIP